jgi:N-acetylmuramoyl-L-alanine amidase
MRRSRRLLVTLVLVLALSLVATTALAAVEPTGTVTAYMLNVRSGPGMTNEIITEIPMGTVVTLLARDSASIWVKVRLADSTVGWVHSYWLETTVEVNTLPLEAESETDAVVYAGKLNIRSGPGVGYPAVSTAVLGERLQLLGRDSEIVWVQVKQIGDIVGWVNSKWISAPIDLATLPEVASYEPPALVLAGKLNVRSGPGAAYAPIGSVTNFDVVMLHGRDASGGWAFVKTPTGLMGWVSTYYLDTLDMPLSALPVVTTIITAP